MMDRASAASLDSWLTTDPSDDGTECHDAFGTPYFHHDWPPSGPCRRCDAEPDPEEDDTADPKLVCWDSDEADAQGFTTHQFGEFGSCERCEYTPDTCVYGWYYTSMDSIGPDWDECGQDAAWRAVRRCRNRLPLCDEHKRDYEQGKLDYVLAPEGDVLLGFEPYDPLTGDDNYSESYHWHDAHEDMSECRCDPQPTTPVARYDAGLIWDWDLYGKDK
jgi:hypothetical protein